MISKETDMSNFHRLKVVGRGSVKCVKIQILSRSASTVKTVYNTSGFMWWKLGAG